MFIKNKELKIGIATFNWSDNFGALLQAYSLQEYLSSKGYDVKIINFSPLTKGNYIKKYVSKSLKGLLNKIESNIKAYKFEKFRKKYLHLTCNTITDRDSLINFNHDFDLIIVGSDQVWNPKWIGQIELGFEFYFLSHFNNITKVSYAASLGITEISIPKDKLDFIIDSLRSFSFLSCREASGVNIVRNIFRREDCVQVLDPTLLNDRAFYFDLCNGVTLKEKDYIFNYVLHDLDGEKMEYGKSLANLLRLNLVNCNGKSGLFKKDYVMPDPVYWLALIKESNFVLTNSFHGLIFCLIFNKPFYVLLLEGELESMNSRITEILNQFNLNDRVLSDFSKLNSVPKSIDWDFVNQRIEYLKKNSFNFLSNFL